jgi:hypothetical protein
MKGVLATLAPEARVVDISHEVPPQDVLRAGLVWRASVPYFPRGSIHVAVVDPGVGGRRRIAAFEARGSLFLAPDNGLIGYLFPARAIRRAVHVSRREFFLETVSATFHGRDIFAPVAARLARGLPLEALGPALESYEREALPRPRRRRVELGGKRYLEESGCIIYVDRFGNAATNLIPARCFRLRELRLGGRRFTRLGRTYADGKPGEPVLLVGSTGHLEVAVNRGSAATTMGLKLGDGVLALWARK